MGHVLVAVAAAFAAATVGAQTPAPAAPTEPDYVIGVEDRLTISVWREPDLARTVIVRPDGKVTFPLVGDLQAAGRTPRQLDDQLTEALAHFIREPVVTVIVEDINSFRVFMLGEFAAQGALVLKSRTRLLEAVALSGGLTPFADKSKLQLVRMEDGRETRTTIDYRKVLNGERPDLNIYLKPGDTLVAN